MASIRTANCMELRLVRAWHQAIACISPSPFVLDSMLAKARFHTVCDGFHTTLRVNSMPQRVADSIHGSAVIKYESEADNYGKKELAFRVQRRISS